ncbi:MAG: hypothetical protein Q8Q84_19790, partial [Hydrogenophaga sp.]|nr:hypothetical protein [Hydrogenophaga sp.]
PDCRTDSPVRNDGRGLKRPGGRWLEWHHNDSPVRNDGRGLKRVRQVVAAHDPAIRPSEMTGVD